MAGTASTVRSWLLLEDPGPWGRDALRDARLPERVGLELHRRCRAAGVRPLLIRRASSNASLAASSSERPHVLRDPFGTRAAVDRTHPASRTSGTRSTSTSPPSDEASGPGSSRSRDRSSSCARTGDATSAAPSAAVRSRGLSPPPFPDATWESSHVGGDRFAGNLVAFPHGLYLGRVRSDEAADVARSYVDGRVSLEHLRGRSCYPMPVQAADHALRTREGFDRLDDVVLERTEEHEGVSTSTFTTPKGRFSVSIAIEESAPSFLTCHSGVAEPAPAYRTIAVVRLDGAASP